MSSSRSITTLPLAPTLIDRLVQNGFRNFTDLNGVTVTDLSEELDIPLNKALEIIQSYELSTSTQPSDGNPIAPAPSQNILSQSATALQLRELRPSEQPIITFSQELDKMLNGGIPRGQLTEFCGVPGIGKTQLSMQLACNVQIPEIFRGAGGESIYIDTEGSFMPERAYEIASELSNHLKRMARTNRDRSQEAMALSQAAAEVTTAERILDSIHYYRCHNQTELLAVLNILPEYIRAHPNVKLVIIDSIAFHFRAELIDVTGRNRALSTIASNLNQLAYNHRLGIVLMNHVTSKIIRNADATSRDSAGGGIFQQGAQMSSKMVLAPALGEQWSHCITNRVMLHYGQSAGGEPVRVATLEKSPSLPTKSVTYVVSSKGIRDSPKSQSNAYSVDPTSKRTRTM